MKLSEGLKKLVQGIGYLGFGALVLNGFLAWFVGTSVLASPFVAVQPNSTVPQYINYQGNLVDGDNVNLDGVYDMTLRIYDDPLGSNILFAETHMDVVVSHGFFSVNLGDGTPVTGEANGNAAGLREVFDSPDRFIGVTVAPFEEMVPRQRFVAVAYAFLAQDAVYAADAGLLDGMNSTDFEPAHPSVLYKPGTSTAVLRVESDNDVSAIRDVRASRDFIAGDDLIVDDLMTAGRARVTGELEFGSLSGFTVETFSLVNFGSNQGYSGFVNKRLTSDSTSFCALSRMSVEDTDATNEWVTCRIGQNHGYWWLDAILDNPDYDADVMCSAHCLVWDSTNRSSTEDSSEGDTSIDDVSYIPEAEGE